MQREERLGITACLRVRVRVCVCMCVRIYLLVIYIEAIVDE